MTIYNVYFDKLEIEKTTLEFAIDKLENSGWYKKGTVEELLKGGNILNNPYCLYATSKQKLINKII